MTILWILADGGPAVQGGIILVGLVLGILAFGAGLLAMKRRRRLVWLVGCAACVLSLIYSAWDAYVFGLPYDWRYWGAYLPWAPLVLSLGGFVLLWRAKTPNQTMHRTAGRSAF